MGVFLPNDAPYSPEHENCDAETGVITYTKDNFKHGFGREEFSLKVRAADALSACLWRVGACANMCGAASCVVHWPNTRMHDAFEHARRV